MTYLAQRELITAKQIQQFLEDGFCVVDGLFTPRQIDEIEMFFEEFKVGAGKIYDGSTYGELDPKTSLFRAMHPHRHSDCVLDWFLHPAIAAVLEALFEKPALGVQTMYYYKPPGARGQGMHQDNFYLAAAPATCIAAWTAIDGANIDNGCLYVAPGSQRRDIYCPGDSKHDSWFEYGDTHINPFPRDLKPVPVPVPKGSTMFFSGNLVHGSGPNRTAQTSRRTFIGHYIDGASDQVSQSYHPVLAMDGTVITSVRPEVGGGPCGDGWQGAPH